MKKVLLGVLPALVFSQAANAQLLITEYIEGSSNNKALEISNIGDDSVDLGQYQIEAYHNGRTLEAGPTFTIGFDELSELAAGNSYVFANSRAFSETLALANQNTGSISFNGDDTLILRNKVTNEVVDSFGQAGFDPGSRWSNNGVSTQNATLRRTELTPDLDVSDAFDPSVAWTAFDTDNIEDLASFNGNGGPDDPVDPPIDFGICGDPATLISVVQGSGVSSPLIGEKIIVEAVVTAVFQGENLMGGYFVQEEDFDADTESSTSEGIYVYDTNTVSVGELVRIQAEVTEFKDITELTTVANLVNCGTASLPTAASLSLPVTSDADFESVEGMLVNFDQTLTVNENYNLGRYGELVLSNGRRFQPTEIAMPGAEAQAIADANELNAIILDDASTKQNPSSIPYPAPGLSAYNSVRSGDTVTNLTAIMHYGFGAYRMMPVGDVYFDPSNARPQSPYVTGEGNLTLASFNVLNFFNGDGEGSGWDDPNNRGADDEFEYERQLDKLLAAFIELDADVVGLMEIENDGYGELSAIYALVEALNALVAEEDIYQFVEPTSDLLGSDAIAVGMLYRPSVVTPTGITAVLESSNSPEDPELAGEPLFNDNKNRAVLTQSFKHIATGNSFTVAVNHFKSKGSDCDALGDPDTGDFQGNCNITRTKAAQALSQWLETYPTGIEDDDMLVMGDLNAYSMEDPIRTFTDKGWVNLKSEGDYSYIFYGQSGNLDHALATPSLAEQVLVTTDWHINTDEPRVLDYNIERKTETQIVDYYAADAFRSSDHDPVVIELDLEMANQAPIADFTSYRVWFWTLLVNTSSDEDGYVESAKWTVGTQEIEKNILFLPNYLLRRNGIKEVTLTVTDDKGATSSVTKSIR